MKKLIYVLILPLAVVSGLALANRESKNESRTKSPSGIDRKTVNPEARKSWEESADGIRFKIWKDSPEGKKVYASKNRVQKHLDNFSEMEAVVIALTIPSSTPATPNGLIVSINGQEYMMQFSAKEFQQLSSLKVNDKIVLKSRGAGVTPKHAYLVLSGDYIERNKQILFYREHNPADRC